MATEARESTEGGGAWPRRHGYVFLLSHMRAYSSVLAHVLGSHPDMRGYLEAGLSYHDPADLRHLAPRLRELGVADTRGRWLVDKILHNAFLLSTPVMADPRVRLILFIRAPASTLSSITKLAKIHAVPWYQDPTAVTAYYCDRLRTLATIARVAACPWVWFPAERLREAPDAVLAGLTPFLNLRPPLSATYALHPKTGQPGFGDPSENIRAGRILSAASSPDTATVPDVFTAAQIKRCQAVYAGTLEVLSRATPAL